MMRKSVVGVALTTGLLAVPLATVAPAMAAPAAPAATARTTQAGTASPVVVHPAKLAVSGGTATFTLTRFVNRDGRAMATGVVRATNSRTHATTTRTVTIPLQRSAQTGVSSAVQAPAATGTCTILDLTLGPLHLDLLGLVIDLNQVHLVITAQQGPGNLLGNRLCAIVNLLNPRSTAAAVNLNRVLGL